MDDLNLAPDEKTLREFERIIISGVRHHVVLTSRRLVIREAESGKVRRDAEYSRIVLAVLSQNTLREPEVSLSFAAAAGEVETDDLIFVHLPAGQNIQAADRCMDILRDHNVPMRADVRASSMKPPSRLDGSSPSTLAKVTPDRPAVPEMTRIGTTYVQQPQKEEAGGIPPAVMIGAAVVVVIAIIAALIFILPGAGSPSGTGSSGPSGTAPVVITPIPVTTATVAVPVTTGTPAMEETQPAPVTASIPENGVWLQVACKGPYEGAVKAGSWHLAINSSGSRLYQLPVQNTLLEGSIGKTEGFGDLMTVKIYNGGQPIFDKSTTKPFGTIEINQPVEAAIISKPAATPAPTASISSVPTQDTTLELKPVPANGTFVRVSYNGEFSGSITANGQSRLVSGSGDQFFQLPLRGGEQIDGFMEKPDGSGKVLVVQVYRDGVLTDTVSSAKPFGLVEFHTVV